MTEYCKEWIEDAWSVPRRCDAVAEFILWGKLFPPNALGPRCYAHANVYARLDPHTLSQSAIYDLRPHNEAEGREEASQTAEGESNDRN